MLIIANNRPTIVTVTKPIKLIVYDFFSLACLLQIATVAAERHSLTFVNCFVLIQTLPI